MKISKSKQELARIISENGGWRDGEFSVMCSNGNVLNSSNKPFYDTRHGWCCSGGFGDNRFVSDVAANNWCHTILSRAEYFHLHPAPDADGWIEWYGGDVSPVAKGAVVDVKMKNGTEHYGQLLSDDCWHDSWGEASVIAYRLHKPEQSKPELCESVMRSIPEPSDKPTIEQLAADYRNAKDYAERKQQEADDAKADADARLKALEIAGDALGLLVSPISANQESELVITDWLDLRVGDVVKITSVFERGNEDYCDVIGTDAVVIYVGDPARQDLVVSHDDMKLHIDGFRFIRRP